MIKIVSDFTREILLKKVEQSPIEARSYIKKMDYKNNHFLLKLIAKTYWNEAKFNKDGNWNFKTNNSKLRLAERYIVKAYEINPFCSDVLWLLGLIRWDYGQNEIAIFCFEEIVYIGRKGLKHKDCKIGLDVCLSRVNDSKFQLYRLHKLKNPELSQSYLNKYLKGLKKGLSTLFIPYQNFLYT